MASLAELAAKRSKPPQYGTPEGYTELERAIGLSQPNVKLRLAVSSIISVYYATPEMPAVRPSGKAKWLDRIAAQAKALRDTLSLDDGDDKTPDGWPQAQAIWELLNEPERGDLGTTLDQLATAAKRARRMVPKDKGGKLGNWRLCAIIASLALAYSGTTGKKPGQQWDFNSGEPRGPFFRFVRAFFEHVAPSWRDAPAAPKSDFALAKAIQRALAKLR